jgi:hypothetical protein
MAARRFVHVGFCFKGDATRQLPIDALEELFGKARDWMRYDFHCWILYTSADLSVWRDRIKKVPGIEPSDNFFLCEFAANRYAGYQQKWFWEWLRKERD